MKTVLNGIIWKNFEKLALSEIVEENLLSKLNIKIVCLPSYNVEKSAWKKSLS